MMLTILSCFALIYTAHAFSSGAPVAACAITEATNWLGSTNMCNGAPASTAWITDLPAAYVPGARLLFEVGYLPSQPAPWKGILIYARDNSNNYVGQVTGALSPELYKQGPCGATNQSVTHVSTAEKLVERFWFDAPAVNTGSVTLTLIIMGDRSANAECNYQVIKHKMLESGATTTAAPTTTPAPTTEGTTEPPTTEGTTEAQATGTTEAPAQTTEATGGATTEYTGTTEAPPTITAEVVTTIYGTPTPTQMCFAFNEDCSDTFYSCCPGFECVDDICAVATTSGAALPTTTPEPVDCEYGEWSAWGPCDTACLAAGGTVPEGQVPTGTRFRTRIIEAQPENGGAACDSDALTDDEACNVDADPCPAVPCLNETDSCTEQDQCCEGLICAKVYDEQMECFKSCAVLNSPCDASTNCCDGTECRDGNCLARVSITDPPTPAPSTTVPPLTTSGLTGLLGPTNSLGKDIGETCVDTGDCRAPYSCDLAIDSDTVRVCSQRVIVGGECTNVLLCESGLVCTPAGVCAEPEVIVLTDISEESNNLRLGLGIGLGLCCLCSIILFACCMTRREERQGMGA